MSLIMEEEQQTRQPNPVKNEVWEWTKAIIIAVILVVLIRWLVFKPFIVDGPSMEPNFITGERLIVNELIYSIRKPQRGEVVVFHATEDKDFIKRVIALPGETVKISEGKLFINGQEMKEDYIQVAIDEYRKYNNAEYNQPFKEITVPEGSVFVMGDNRVNSTDSRVIGPVTYNKIIGRADVIFWPISKIGMVYHK